MQIASSSGKTPVTRTPGGSPESHIHDWNIVVVEVKLLYPQRLAPYFEVLVNRVQVVVHEVLLEVREAV